MSPKSTSGPCLTLAPGPRYCGLEPLLVSAPAGGDVSAPAIVLEFSENTVAVVTRTSAQLLSAAPFTADAGAAFL